MAWFASDQKFKDDPKTIKLMSDMKWSLDVTIGKWHRLIWWCIEYAEDGHLNKYELFQICEAIGLDPKEGRRFKKALLSSGYATENPNFRIENWWDIMGKFLTIKYKKKKSIWIKIRNMYGITEETDESGTVPGSDIETNIGTEYNTRKTKALKTSKNTTLELQTS